MKKIIYLDHAATTPVRKEVLEAMLPFFSEKFGNPSSRHKLGEEARDALEKARKSLARTINARTNEIVFTGSGTESDNLAIKGVAFANKEKGKHIITTKIEHKAVLNTCRWLEKNGFEITYLDTDKYGFVNPRQVEEAIREDTILVSVMHANNEIGTIEPIEEIARICKKHRIYFHTDAVQSFCKLPIDVKKMNISLLTASSHKIYGPKGVGFLYVNRKVDIEPIIHGGNHEFGLRSGTENIACIVGFAKAAELAIKEMPKEMKRLKKLRDYMIEELSKIKGSHLNGHPTRRLANNVNFWFEGIEGEFLILELSQNGVMASTQSACSSHSLKPSHVLEAIGLTPEQTHGSLRLTLGKDNTRKDIEKAVEIIKKSIKKLRKFSFW